MYVLCAFILCITFTLSAQETEVKVLETFEDSSEVPVWMNANNGDAPSPAVVANPQKKGLNPSDSVMRWVKDKDGPVFAAAMSDFGSYNIEFKDEAQFIHLKMLKSNTDPCALQIIRAKDGEETAKFRQPAIRVPCPTPNKWVDYVFYFDDTTATNHKWSRFYFMPVMNSKEQSGWSIDTLEENINVYFDEIIIDSVDSPYKEARTSVYVNQSGDITYVLNNPVTNELILEGIGNVTQISLYNIKGKLLKQYSPTNQNRYIIPVSDLTNGVYLVRFINKHGTIDVQKIIKR